MTLSVDIRNLTLSYGETQAIAGLSLRLDRPGIYGLLGRNGSGKTSLLSVIAGLRRQTGGQVLIDGEPVFENENATTRICLIREGGDTPDSSEKIGTALDFAAQMRPYWSTDYAEKLLDGFKLSRKLKIGNLSRGQRSALACTLGLASRAPLTMLDEAYLGMDAPARYAFYEALLADFMEHPRMIVLSTHLIEEVAKLFSEVVIIHEGRLVLQEDADALRGRGATVIGPVPAVERATSGMNVLAVKDLGPTRSAAVYGDIDRLEAAARTEGLEFGALPIQDIFVHLTANGGQA